MIRQRSGLVSDLDFHAYARAIGLRVAIAALWLVTAVHLSDTSTYHIRGITPPTFGIAMMLTPWGMAQNLFDRSSYLRPFYMSVSERYGLFDDASLRWTIFLWMALSFALLILFFRPAGRSSLGFVSRLKSKRLAQESAELGSELDSELDSEPK